MTTTPYLHKGSDTFRGALTRKCQPQARVARATDHGIATHLGRVSRVSESRPRRSTSCSSGIRRCPRQNRCEATCEWNRNSILRVRFIRACSPGTLGRCPIGTHRRRTYVSGYWQVAGARLIDAGPDEHRPAPDNFRGRALHGRREMPTSCASSYQRGGRRLRLVSRCRASGKRVGHQVAQPAFGVGGLDLPVYARHRPGGFLGAEGDG